jgi:hypothetical protein
MTAEPISLAAYLRVRRFVETYFPDQDLRRGTRNWWNTLQEARSRYQSRAEARREVGWPYDR